MAKANPPLRGSVAASGSQPAQPAGQDTERRQTPTPTTSRRRPLPASAAAAAARLAIAKARSVPKATVGTAPGW
eukprot:12924638-Prorocentrum_lima.AAC.1